jgi:hypothetical protein
MLKKIVNKVRAWKIFSATRTVKRAWIISGAAAVVVVGLAVGTSVSVARTSDIGAEAAKPSASTARDLTSNVPSIAATDAPTAAPTVVPSVTPTVAPKPTSSSASGSSGSSKSSVSTPVTTPKVTKAAPTTTKVVAKPVAPKPAPAPAPPKVVTPPPAPVYTSADAATEVVSHYGAKPMSGECVLVNYGSWTLPNTPPPPALQKIGTGGWLGYTASASAGEGTVHYYACYS